MRNILFVFNTSFSQSIIKISCLCKLKKILNTVKLTDIENFNNKKGEKSCWGLEIKMQQMVGAGLREFEKNFSNESFWLLRFPHLTFLHLICLWLSHSYMFEAGMLWHFIFNKWLVSRGLEGKERKSSNKKQNYFKSQFFFKFK